MQTEITKREKLLVGNGRLTRPGYARSPLQEYNPENIRVYPGRALNRLRLKEWDYYGITARDFFFSATVSHIGYAGMVFVYFIDFAKGFCVERSITIPLGKGCDLPHSSEQGDILFENPGARLSFVKKGDRRELSVWWKGFHEGDCEANITLFEPRMDSLVITTPIGAKRFYYNRKINCMPAEGSVTVAGKKRTFSRKDAMGTLDWGRGVWEYSSFWNWASASGFLPGGGSVGLNLGCGFGDLSAATENCFFINGAMTKLDWVDISYDPSSYMRPWYFSSRDGRLNLTLTPFFERVAKTNLLVIASEVHQMFGTYRGTLRTDAGREQRIDGLTGWAEEHRARW
ncbi:MAG: DUF2804 domain-containing protein [Spirochaetes bacterium]|nr:MAG: DUF2804 domain-containing protein [Spirochaetota bacterium]